MSKNIAQLSRRKGLQHNLFEKISQLSQHAENPKVTGESIKKIAKQFLVGEVIVYATASFYDFTLGENAQKQAYVCNGTSCMCAGTQKNILEILGQYFSSEDIGHVNCLGRCHENAAFQIAGKNYSGSDITHIDHIIQLHTDSEETLPGSSKLEASVLLSVPENISDYYKTLSQMIQTNDEQQLLNMITESGLRGRGGAGFPTGMKWQSCYESVSDEKYIVCNADEGDPGAFSDRYLLEENPHAVLSGMLVAAWICKAHYGILYIRDEYPEAITECEKAIEQFSLLNLELGNDFNFQFKIIRGAGAYICGEETALLNSIEGQRPVVSVRPPFPTENGLFSQPTVLNNVETFASIPFILKNGAEAFNKMGRGKSTGSKLISLDSSFNCPGVYEVLMGTPLSDIIEIIGGGFSRPTKALHIGGPLGGLVPIHKINNLTLDFESFQQQGFLLGHGSIIGIPESMPLMDYVQHLFEFTAEESCGKCFPCRLGATRGVEMFQQALNNTHPLNKILLNDLLDTMEKGSLCALGGGVPLPIKNALQWFPEEFSAYFEDNKNFKNEPNFENKNNRPMNQKQNGARIL